MNQKKTAIIVAGGKGKRMNTEIPKQFLELNGKPILIHTLEKFHQFSNEIELILVLPSTQIDLWRKLCKKHQFFIKHKIVKGGSSRFHSVKNGLSAVKNSNGLIAIHDGVRPLVDIETIKRSFDGANEFGASIPVIDVVDSIRKVSGNENEAVDRNVIKLVQTPQVFRSKIILKSYEQPYRKHFTDDASVVESAGYSVKLVEGNRENIKITHMQDLQLAEILLKQILKF
ncbi:MAG: 2-C-methyl-D-erythritol 4-phosphate cytidylyltransferase [Bacteroidales bacterium]|nr:2-C-methyl-D-erythritol 4-phosphate cytidylyltransferase [Bacteroidales bacterium]